jgi:hypothetical protein
MAFKVEVLFTFEWVFTFFRIQVNFAWFSFMNVSLMPSLDFDAYSYANIPVASVLFNNLYFIIYN